MNARTGAPGNPRHGWIMPAIQVLGLAGTGWIIWIASIAPRLHHRYSPLAILLDAFKYALLAWIWSATLTLVLWAALDRNQRPGILPIVLRTSRTAVWFAPACLLLSQLSPAVVIPALVLVGGTTRLLYSDWLALQPPAGAPPPASAPFQLLPSPAFLRAFGPGVAAAFGLQAGFLAESLGSPLAAAALFSMTAALLTLMALNAGLLETEHNTSLPRSILGIVLTIILAAGLTTVHGLARYLGARAASVARTFTPNSSEEESGTNAGGAVIVSDKVFPGVILWPEIKPYATLVAPPPSWLKTSPASDAARPFTIPFSGEYWMFKAPQVRPPPGAFFQRGTPVALFYATTDHSRMLMEAHQKLDHDIDMRCCRAIRIALSNADRFPGTVSLELILIDAQTTGRRAVSLGSHKVNAFPQTSGWPVSPVSDLIEFPMPASSDLRQFNEIQIVIHRDPVRMDKSARMAIQRFILVPRSA